MFNLAFVLSMTNPAHLDGMVSHKAFGCVETGLFALGLGLLLLDDRDGGRDILKAVAAATFVFAFTRALSHTIVPPSLAFAFNKELLPALVVFLVGIYPETYTCGDQEEQDDD